MGIRNAETQSDLLLYKFNFKAGSPAQRSQFYKVTETVESLETYNNYAFITFKNSENGVHVFSLTTGLQLLTVPSTNNFKIIKDKNTESTSVVSVVGNNLAVTQFSAKDHVPGNLEFGIRSDFSSVRSNNAGQTGKTTYLTNLKDGHLAMDMIPHGNKLYVVTEANQIKTFNLKTNKMQRSSFKLGKKALSGAAITQKSENTFEVWTYTFDSRSQKTVLKVLNNGKVEIVSTTQAQ